MAAFLYLPDPYNIGLLPLVVGWIILPFTRRHSIGRYTGTVILQFGLLLVFSAAVLPFIIAWSARIHELSLLSTIFTPLLSWGLTAVGIAVNFADGTLQLSTFEDVISQSLSSEKVLPLPLILFTALWSMFIVLRSEHSRLERLVFFWIISFSYTFCRYAILFLVTIERVNPSWYWDPLMILVSLVPLVALTKEPDDLPSKRTPSNQSTRAGKTPRWSFFMGLAFGISIIFAFSFRDPGKPSYGSVLINEHGSDWEWTTEPLDTVNFSEKTTYNYYCLAQFLDYFYQVDANFEPLSTERLKNVDVLILKTPTQAFNDEEIAAVVEFVERGGGLWVIGDHTNVFGSSSYLNPLLKRFGLKLNYDSTHDLQTGKLSLYRKPSIFAHPTVQHLPHYLFATSCTISAPWRADGAIIGYGLRSDKLDYSQKNFFPDRSRKLFDNGFGIFLQQAALNFGKGRILLYTDSTTFSNFFTFIKGKPELILGSISWLNRTNYLGWIKSVALVTAILFLLAIILTSRWNGASFAGMLLGLIISTWSVQTISIKTYPLPEPTKDVPWVNFEREHSGYFLPTLRLAEKGDKSYLTFFVWTQRVGAVPREMDDLSEAAAQKYPMVMIDPAAPFTDVERRELQRYLQRGGKLLLINSADNIPEAANQLLMEYGVELIVHPVLSDFVSTLTLAGRQFPLVIDGEYSSIRGGTPFLKSDQGDVIGVTLPVGKGKIWVFSCGHLFRNEFMGHTTVTPDEGLKALYRIEFDLIRDLIFQTEAESLGEIQKTKNDNLSDEADGGQTTDPVMPFGGMN
ncbi:hypothetical protein CEE37_11390 [candidate division LCP-89 bacterium B3_LCP]|uniref:ABC-type uncharacterized transport system domain-containing protein n=1 Tax=candidate division LCP-89 bacterium B3_LCP TaxID=2012998 RepID=A0A532UVS4_UNCL8|nr:MAG: hypothetical protein CEE37_11390 [candidate division LCP-89 bacterium B3_LCP]